jgi:glutathione synthase
MTIAFIINEIAKEQAHYTTTHLAWAAYRMGHQIFIAGVGELGYNADGHLTICAKTVANRKFKSAETFFKALQTGDDVRVSSENLDVIFLRNDPSQDINKRNWAQNAPYIFSQIALNDGVIVVNSPEKLSDAINKMYFQHFPKVLRPETIITRDAKEIEDFFERQKHKIILKPLQGSGGKNVFLVDKKNRMNLSQIIEAISRDGYIIAQEYLPEATKGDIRLFLMNGIPLKVDGKYAAIRRVNKADDIRSNLSAGGSTKKVQVTEEILTLARVLRPKLVKDGMFLVGIDIVGNKLMEVNVFSPGTMSYMNALYDVNFCEKVITALEKKTSYKKLYGNSIDNNTIATM